MQIHIFHWTNKIYLLQRFGPHYVYKINNTVILVRIVIGNFMKRLCTCLIIMTVSNQISFETKQKSKQKVDFNFIFISIKKIFWKYPKFF